MMQRPMMQQPPYCSRSLWYAHCRKCCSFSCIRTRLLRSAETCGRHCDVLSSQELILVSMSELRFNVETLGSADNLVSGITLFLTGKPHSGRPLQTRLWYSWQWAMSFSLFVYRCGVSDGCDASVVLNRTRPKLISLPVCCKTPLALKTCTTIERADAGSGRVFCQQARGT